mgnify:CR=1 FL=1
MKTPGHIEVYLYFNGNCEEALTFYADVLGGEITASCISVTCLRVNRLPSPNNSKSRIMLS